MQQIWRLFSSGLLLLVAIQLLILPLLFLCLHLLLVVVELYRVDYVGLSAWLDSSRGDESVHIVIDRARLRVNAAHPLIDPLWLDLHQGCVSGFLTEHPHYCSLKPDPASVLHWSVDDVVLLVVLLQLDLPESLVAS